MICVSIVDHSMLHFAFTKKFDRLIRDYRSDITIITSNFWKIRHYQLRFVIVKELSIFNSMSNFSLYSQLIEGEKLIFRKTILGQMFPY